MSIWLLIALVSYLLGVVVEWLRLRQEFQKFDEYANFPIVWAAKIVTIAGCLFGALTWPYSLILGFE